MHLRGGDPEPTLITMRALILVVFLVLGSVACTPGRHRAYQITMITIGSAGVIHSGLQTYTAMRDDPIGEEGNPVIRAHPQLLAGAVALNLTWGAGTLILPREGTARAWNGNQMPNWMIDVLATTYAVFGSWLAYNDTTMTSTRWYR